MHGTLEFLLRHGYLLLVAWVFLEQAGLPVPSVPLMLAAGALAGVGRMNIGSSLALCIVAAVAADTIWYFLGRTQGIKILQWLCKVSLEPDSCVRRTEGLFEKQGARSLVFAKFSSRPQHRGHAAGRHLSHAAAQVSCCSMRSERCSGPAHTWRWAISSADRSRKIAQSAAALGGWLLVVLVLGFIGYVVYKYIARQNFLRDLRISRISVDELKQKIDAGEQLAIVDLRHSIDFEANPETIPGAYRMDARELSEKSEQLPQNREVILYCT